MEYPSIEHLVVTCHLGDIDTPSEAHVFVAPFPCRLAAAGIVTATDVPLTPDDFAEVALVRRRGGEERPIVTKTTRAETGEAISAGAYWHFDVCAWDPEARVLPTGTVVSLRSRPGGPAGTGPSQRLAGVLTVLRYEPT